MTQFQSTLRIFTVLAFVGLVFTGCTKDETDPANNEALNSEELRMATEMDDIEMVLEDVVIASYEVQESSETANRAYRNPPAVFPPCVTVTAVIQLNHREITIDFGTEGCLFRGRLFRGQVYITYDRDPEAHEILITYNLIDFYVGPRQVIGNRTILRELSNENGNPQFTHTLDLTVIWPNGMQASREGVKIREWVEGFGNDIFTDDVFEITGHWNATFLSGNTHSYDVITPLRREVTCIHFVSGSIDVVRTNFSGVLDFGDGTCDNQATFTLDNGEVVNITLN